MIVGAYSVGATKEPILYSIVNNKVDHAVFFCSKETVIDLKEITTKAGLEAGKFDHFCTDDSDDIDKCYATVEMITKRLQELNPDEVFIDITGGTKAMVASLMTGTSGRGYQYIYIGGISGKRNTETGRVISGGEKIYLFDDPVKKHHEQEKKLLVKFFNSYNYSGVIKIIELLKLQTHEEDFYNGLKLAAEGYMLWDSFMHEEAIPKLDEAYKYLMSYSKYNQYDSSKILIANIAENKTILKDIAKFKQYFSEDAGDIKKFCKHKENNKSLIIAADLFYNAQRRNIENKFEDAVVRLYACIELIGKLKLARHGLIDSDIDRTLVPTNYILPEPSDDGKIKLALYNKFRLLQNLGDETSMLFNDMDFRGLMNARNSLFLAHGLSSVTERQYLSFRDKVASLLGEQPEIKFPKIEVW